MRRWLRIFLLIVFLSAGLPAEQFVFIPLWGSAAEGVAQWKISSVPLSIEQLDLLYNLHETSIEYLQKGYAVYDMELRLTRLKKDFTPQNIEFLVQMYDKQGRVLLERDYLENLFTADDLDFSALNTAVVKLPGFTLEREPVRIKIWIKSYVDQNGETKDVLNPRRKHRDRDKDTTVIIIRQ
ncbi:hypothetical protein NO1_0822 [Candidatus Termititenax aidoneus]|uniref:Uncharacterized protein n=1 Tax=Termititenax aidoneus TaxID=2218524 RepID=A0A388TAU5_TERA1|nr:hypothetical protein NO1_0822 [Candidatus Termititenax aidoneus]